MYYNYSINEIVLHHQVMKLGYSNITAKTTINTGFMKIGLEESENSCVAQIVLLAK